MADNVVNATFAFGELWLDAVGGTGATKVDNIEGGVTVEYEFNTEEAQFSFSTFPVGDVVTTESMIVTAKKADVTISELSDAFGGATSAGVLGGGAAKYNAVEVHVPLNPNHTSSYLKIDIPYAINKSSPTWDTNTRTQALEMRFEARRKDSSTDPVTFTLVV